MYIVPAHSDEAIGSDPVIWDLYSCYVQTRNEGRYFGEAAYGKGMLILLGRMLIVMMICGASSRLLEA